MNNTIKSIPIGLITKPKTFKASTKPKQQKLFELSKKNSKERQPIPKLDIFTFEMLK